LIRKILFKQREENKQELSMSNQAPIFEETLRNYLNQVAQLDLTRMAKPLGIRVEQGEAFIPFFGRVYRVSSRSIFNPSGREPLHALSVVLCKYLLLFSEKAPQGGEDWVSYKDFRDAAPFVTGFVNNSERAIARNFTNRLNQLRAAAEQLGASPPDLELSYQFSARFEVLPRVPLLLLFNDEDEDFPAQCSLLFQRRAEEFLDMECLAIIGWLLADFLARVAGLGKRTVM
jgi:hypothetical protein